MIHRRDVLRVMGSGFGLLGLAGLVCKADSTASAGAPLAVKPPHFPAKAKQVIYLFLNGGPSQVDTFDPKPLLAKYHGQPAPTGNLKTERKTGNLLRSPFQFKKCGKSGIEVSEIFPALGQRIDDVCVIRSMYTDRPNHEPSLFRLNCGNPLPGYPSMGSWLTYGLGTLNQNLPGFVVLCPGLPVVGPQLWSSSFLPSVHQGTYIPNNEIDPQKQIQHLRNAQYDLGEQRRQLDLLGSLDQLYVEKEGPDPRLESAIQSMEIAYRMQTEAMEAFDIRKESEATRARYGEGDFARGCLLARRLVERGVRMVQVYFGNMQPWDNHDDILIHRKLAAQADRPIAALLDDLKSTGLFGETIVMIGGEFGRTPAVEVSGLVSVQNGRDHNNHGFSMLLAGGGIKGGTTYGATDDFGFKAIENPVNPNDVQATVLQLLGLDHTKLTYRYSGRDFRLTDVQGNVVKEIIA
jgi:Protein of unknown function (DUF1501)